MVPSPPSGERVRERGFLDTYYLIDTVQSSCAPGATMEAES